METMRKPADTAELMEHLDHVDYPVTGKELFEACSNMSHIPEEQREWAKRNIQENKTYNSRDELRTELKL